SQQNPRTDTNELQFQYINLRIKLQNLSGIGAHLYQFLGFVDSCDGEKHETLRKFLHAESLNRSNNYITDEDSAHQYSPVYIGPQEGFKAANKIIALPGEPKDVKFDQYSEYVTVDPTAGRALFYYISESENPSSKPLVLWLNQGRGCSSLGAGAMSGKF
ncbi:unnamed protein product, partial [Coffea canephora]